MTPDDVLAEMLRIRSDQENLDPGSEEYDALESRRLQLIAMSRDALDQTRGRETLLTELANLRTRLAELDDEKIDVPGWQQAMARRRRLVINDPAAHASQINAELDKKAAAERDAIAARIEQLNTALEE